MAQTRSRLAGVMPDSATRMVSFHDVDARPIRKGRLGKPVKFGYKAQVVDNADGVILDHTVEIGNPADAPQLAAAITRIAERAGRAPTAVTADRGYGYAAVDAQLHELGVRHVAIPRASKPSATCREFEHRKAFRAKIKWRTGCQGRNSHLKRSYGWNRTELTTLTGAPEPGAATEYSPTTSSRSAPWPHKTHRDQSHRPRLAPSTIASHAVNPADPRGR